MSTVGIVAEYDPFHCGHLYQMRKARELSGADSTVVILGGDFLQRGSPCMVDKRVRAQMAVDAGADLVLALPYVFSVNSAREYAEGAVRILAGTGCTDYISFGCEEDDPSLLNRAASVLAREKELSPLLKDKLSAGLSWPEAYTQAVDELGGQEISGLLRQPNNLLACEYLRATAVQGASLKPVPVRRVESEEDDSVPDTNGGMHFLSASRIRSVIKESGIQAAEPYVPASTMQCLREAYGTSAPWVMAEGMGRRMLDLLRYRLLTADRSGLRNVYSVGEGLENRLTAVIADPDIRSVHKLAGAVATKRYTKARIMRMLVHILMDFKKDDFEWLRGVSCARVLACNEQGRKLLARMRKTSGIPVLSNLAGRNRYDARTRRLLELEIKAAGLYEMLQGGPDLTGGEIRYVPYMP